MSLLINIVLMIMLYFLIVNYCNPDDPNGDLARAKAHLSVA
ncbi:MAG TPA: hypothetical protein VGK06_16425 [Methanosarcina sp.]